MDCRTQDISGVPASCTRGLPITQPLDQRSLLQSIGSLRMALASATASAQPLSRESVASLDDVRSTTVVIEASASRAVQAAQASASDAISSAQVSIASSLSTAADAATHGVSVSNLTWIETPHSMTKPQKQPPNEDMPSHISVPLAVIAIISTATGTCLLTLLGYFLFAHRHQLRRQVRKKEKKEVSAALDRAITSCIAEEVPNPKPALAPDWPQQSRIAMTTAVDANAMDTPQDEEQLIPSPPPSHHEPPTPFDERRASLWRTETSITDTSRAWRRTASSHFMDSAERVYADILARPLELVRIRSPFQPAEPTPTPPARDDVGWPLPTKQNWI